MRGRDSGVRDTTLKFIDELLLLLIAPFSADAGR
jgi:hypothetical protein